MDLLQDQVKKLYLRFLLPSLGSAMVMSIYTLSLVTLAVVALALWLIYGLGISELLRVMGANDTLFPYALTYMKYINLFLPVAVFSNFIAIFVRADGDPNRAMAGVLLGGNSLWMVMPTVEIIVLLFSAVFLKQHRQRR